MTDETNYPPKSKVKLPTSAKKKRKGWWQVKKKTYQDPRHTSDR